jgi:hypothetical protein
MDIITFLIAIIGGIVGVLSTLYLVISFPVVLIWKIYRSVRYGVSLNA